MDGTNMLKVLSAQTGSASEYSIIGKALKKTSTSLVFDFLILVLNIWTSKFWATSYKNASNPPTYWDNGLYGHKPQSFPPNRAPKMLESQQLF